MKQITALFALLFCASLVFGQTIEKSQSIMIYDIKPTVAPCTFCSERAFVRADNTEYWWNGSAWVKWYDGNSYLTALVQDSIIVTTRFGVEVDRDTVRVAGGSGGGSGSGSTNLDYVPSATEGVVTSDTGTDATILAGSTVNASLMLPADKAKLDTLPSGLGNVNNISLWTETRRLGNSVISQLVNSIDGPNVGINTTFPRTGLEIQMSDPNFTAGGLPGPADKTRYGISIFSDPDLAQSQPGIIQYYLPTSYTGNAAFSLSQIFTGNSELTAVQKGNFGIYTDTDGPSYYLYLTAASGGNHSTSATLKVDANNRIGIGIPGTDRPSYLLDLGGTSAAARFTPHNTALTGIEGLLFAHDASNYFKGHDGTSLYRFPKYSDVAASDGQVGVYNLASDRWVPSTISTLLNTQTNYQIDVSENPAGTNFRTVYGGNSEAAIGVTQDGADAAIVEISVYNSDTNAKSVITLDEGEASIEGNVARVKGADAIMESRGVTRLISTGIGFPIKQTYLTLLDTGSVLVETTGLPNFAGVQYQANHRAKFTDFSLVDKGYVDNLFAQGFQGSIVLPDSLVSILTTDGAGIEFFSDYVNLVGTEVMANGQVIPMQDTLVIAVYCQPHGEAAATGNDYRGWRVPPDLDGARLIGVHYSFDTPGSDTALIQLGNGTVNVFGGTIPATGFVNVTASRVLVANEKWTPSIGTLNGTGHEGLMLNLIIERNR